MTLDWPCRAVSVPRLLAAWLSTAMLATPPAAAQGGGGSGVAGAVGGIDPPGSSAATGLGSGGQQGQARPGLTTGTGPQAGQAVDHPPRPELVEQQRAAGVAPPTEHLREQLQDLNEISRQIAPSVPVPAPRMEETGADR